MKVTVIVIVVEALGKSPKAWKSDWGNWRSEEKSIQKVEVLRSTKILRRILDTLRFHWKATSYNWCVKLASSKIATMKNKDIKCWTVSRVRGVINNSTGLEPTKEDVSRKHCKNRSNSICRLHEQNSESIDHLVFNSLILIPMKHKERYDKIRQYRYWKICKYHGVLESEKRYIHQQELITVTKETTIHWDVAIQIDRKIKSYKVHRVVRDNKRKTCLLTVMCVPTDHRILVNEWNKMNIKTW